MKILPPNEFHKSLYVGGSDEEVIDAYTDLHARYLKLLKVKEAAREFVEYTGNNVGTVVGLLADALREAEE